MLFMKSRDKIGGLRNPIPFEDLKRSHSYNSNEVKTIEMFCESV